MKREISFEQLIMMIISTSIGIIISSVIARDPSSLLNIIWVVFSALIIYFMWGEKV